MDNQPTLIDDTPPPSLVPESVREAFDSIGFTLIRPIGVGGMATVYLATEDELGREVAIKVIRDDSSTDEGVQARFAREAQRIAGLEHENILTVFRAGSVAGQRYIAMQLAPKGDLNSVLRKAPMEPASAAEMAERIARALAFAHERGIVHRDLKPANVFLTESGAPVLADFGIAKSLVEPGHTQIGMVIGTPRYMSPEQLRGDPVDEKTDVYAFGLLLFEMLTQTMARQRDDRGALRGALPHDARHFADIVYDCLQSDPALRPTAAECATRIARESPGRNHRRWVAGAAAALSLMTAAGLHYLMDVSRTSTLELDMTPTDARVYLDGQAVTGGGLQPKGPDSQIALVRRGYHGQLLNAASGETGILEVVLHPLTVPTSEEKQRFHERFDRETLDAASRSDDGINHPIYRQLMQLKRRHAAGDNISAQTTQLETLAALGDDAAGLTLFLASAVSPPLIDLDPDVARSWVARASNPGDDYGGYGLASHYRAIEILQARGLENITRLDREMVRDLLARAYAQGLDWPRDNMGWYAAMVCNAPLETLSATTLSPAARSCLRSLPQAMERCLPELRQTASAALFYQCLKQAGAAI